MLKNVILKYKSLHLPPHILAIRLFNQFINKAKKKKQVEQLKNGNYINPTKNIKLKNGPFYQKEINISELKNELIDYLNSQYINHFFDYLGSGWVNLNKTEKTNKSAFKSTNPLLNHVSKDYKFIDWQRDFKNDFKFDVSQTFLEVKFTKGADVKVPWELSRLQFLPRLAIFSIAKPEVLSQNIIEFKNVVFDFEINNPVGFGVNWVSPMDVAIRLANIGLAFDLFCTQDKNLKNETTFCQTLATHFYQGAKFIFNNLENKQGRTGNHYIFNLLGLLTANKYLQESDETKRWYEFAKNELGKEIQKQFYQDGFNAEASSAYHFFTSEAVFVAIYFLEERDRLELFQKNESLISAIISASNAILKSDYTIPQIGDNDSGKLFNLTPNGELSEVNELKENYLNLKKFESFKNEEFDENLLLQTNYFGMVKGLFGGSISKSKASLLEQSLFSTIGEINSSINGSEEISNSFKPLKFKQEKLFLFADYSNINIDVEAKWQNFPKTGWTIFKTENLYLHFNYADEKIKNHGWRHKHNDILNLELEIDSKPILQDPGSFVYTSNIEKRNYFRSTQVHNVPMVNGLEQNRYLNDLAGVFNMVRDSKTELLEISNRKLIAQLITQNTTFIRSIEIKEEGILVTDFCNRKFVQNFNASKYFSPGYGKLTKSNNPKF